MYKSIFEDTTRTYGKTYGIDKKKFHMKNSWSNLMIYWSCEAQCFCYVDFIVASNYGNNEILDSVKFKINGNGNISKASDDVVNKVISYSLTEIINNKMFSNIKIKTNNKEKKMATNRNYIGEYGIVKVTYDSAKEYCFKIDMKLHKKARVGQRCVVDGNNDLSVVTISEVVKMDLSKETIYASNQATAWVIDLVDDKAHNKRIEATERSIFIQRELQERKKAIEEKQVWVLLAQQDPEAKKLLDELDKINGKL